MKAKWMSLFVVFVMLCVSLSLTETRAEVSKLDKGVSIMCIGESTTYGNGTVSAFRGPLYRLYQQADIKVNFVGPITEKNGDLPKGFGHAGIGGLYIREIADRVNSWLESYQPQVVFLTIGGNDISQGKADKFPDDTRETAPERLKNLALQIVQQRPDVELYVASITPSNNGYAQYRRNFNDAAKPLVEELAQTYSNIHYVDIGSSITELKTDLQSDGLHPTEQGYQKMAQSWFDVTQQKIRSMPLCEPPRLMKISRSGSYMAEMYTEGEKSFSNMSSNSVKIEPNTDYVAKFYLKGDSGTSILVKINTTVNNAWKDVVTKTCTPGPEWATYTMRFNSGNYTSAFFAVFDSSTHPGTVYMDDFSLAKEDDLDKNLVNNPGFELQTNNWSNIKGMFSIVRSRHVILPPATLNRPLGNVRESKRFTFDEADDRGLPFDIECAGFNNNKLYTQPDKVTTNFLSTSDKGKIFYEDPQTGKVSIMLHPSDSWQPVRFGLIKGSTGNGRYNDITGFDEIQITFRILQRTDGSVDYSAKKASDYPLSITMSEIYDSSSTIGSSNKVEVSAQVFNQEQICIIKRQEFAGNTLDMEGPLKKYYDEDNKQHHIQLSLQAKAGVGTMIDEIVFVWYEDSGNLEYKTLNFVNNGKNINAEGLTEGTTMASADIYNSKAVAHTGAAFVAVLYNKAEGVLVDLDIQEFDIDAKETRENVQADVTIPDGDNAENYEIKIFLWDDTRTMYPVTEELRFDTSGASGQE